MVAPVLEANESTILTRVINPDWTSLSPAVAAELLTWEFSEEDRTQMSDLAAKARAGSLTEDERYESESCERVSNFLLI